MKVIFSSVYSCLWFPSVKDVFVKYSKVEKILKGSNDLIPSPLTDKWHILASAASDRKSAKIHHDFSWFYQKMFYSKDKNKAEFKNLDNFDVLSSDFEALKTPAASLTSSASAASLVSATSTTLFPQRTS